MIEGKNGYLSWFVLKYVDNTKQTSMEYFDLIHTILYITHQLS